MAATIIDGKEIARNLREKMVQGVKQLKSKGIVPGLAVVLVGDNQASRTYVTMKQKTCQELGMHSVLIEYPESLTEKDLLEKIQQLNNDDQIHGILVQLPLPKHINEKNIIEAISPEKDVDGFHPISVGRMMTGQDTFLPCTPFGVLEMLRYIQYPISGKHVVVIGRSNIVGKPVGQLLLNENATVTYCHSKTSNLSEMTKQADIVISAVGKTKLISGMDIKPGAVVIDVGMNRDENGKLCGDVDFDSAKQVASFITPVPGGVGPMTITMLMYNTLKSAEIFLQKQ